MSLCKRLGSKSFNPCPHTFTRLEALINDRELPFRTNVSEVTDLSVKTTLGIIEANIAPLLEIGKNLKNCDGNDTFLVRQRSQLEQQRLFWFNSHFRELSLRDRLLLSHLLFVERIGAAQMDEAESMRWRRMLVEANQARELKLA